MKAVVKVHTLRPTESYRGCYRDVAGRKSKARLGRPMKLSVHSEKEKWNTGNMLCYSRSIVHLGSSASRRKRSRKLA